MKLVGLLVLAVVVLGSCDAADPFPADGSTLIQLDLQSSTLSVCQPVQYNLSVSDADGLQSVRLLVDGDTLLDEELDINRYDCSGARETKGSQNLIIGSQEWTLDKGVGPTEMTVELLRNGGPTRGRLVRTEQ